MKHFHSDFADPAAFDVVVNTGVLGVDGACETIRTAVQRLPKTSLRHAT
jgi:hypothetical protein